MLILYAVGLSDVPFVSSKFGLEPLGSLLSYQQKLESGCMINLYGQPSFPDPPLNNVMHRALSVVLNNKLSVSMESLSLG